MWRVGGGIHPWRRAQSGVSHVLPWDKGGGREVGGWREGSRFSFLLKKPPVLWAAPSWLLAVCLVGMPRLGLGPVAGVSSAETELWLGHAPHLWLELI